MRLIRTLLAAAIVLAAPLAHAVTYRGPSAIYDHLDVNSVTTSGTVSASSFAGPLAGNAATASMLATARAIALGGDLSGSATFDGSAGITITGTFAPSGVTAGTYGSSTCIPVVVVDAKGRVTGATCPTISLSAIGAAARGANTDITSLGGLTTPLSAAQGGTGASSLSAALDAAIGSIRATLTVRGAVTWGGLTPSVSGCTFQFNGTDTICATASPGTGALRYDTGQSLTSAQQEQTRRNAGAAYRDDLTSTQIQLAKFAGKALTFFGSFTDDFQGTDGVDTVNSVNVVRDAATNAIFNQASDANTKSLFHFDGTAGSTTFTDAVSGHTVTASGAVAISTTQSVFGGASLRFPGGSSDYISIATSTDFGFGTGDFTINCRIWIDSSSGNGRIFVALGNTSTGFELYQRSTGTIALYDYNVGGLVVESAGISSNTWYDVELTRASGTMRLFMNGALVSSVANTSNFGTTNSIRLGNGTGGGSPTAGYMDELRVSNIARHTAAFTSASSAFPYGATAALDLRSVALTAQAVPTRASIYALIGTTSGSVTLNTNLTASVTRDGGTTWTAFTLAQIGTIGSYGVYAAYGLDISGQPSALSVKYRLQTVGSTLGVAVDAVGFSWN